jgi:hypothetical protein
VRRGGWPDRAVPGKAQLQHQVPGGDLMGLTRQVRNRPLTDRTSAFGRGPATGSAASGLKMSGRSPRNVICR